MNEIIHTLLWIGLTTILLHNIYGVLERYFFQKKTGGKKIPRVRGGLPFVGHGLHSWWNMDGFLSNCYKKYGGIFRVKLFRFNMVLICDENIAKTYLKDPLGSFSIVSWLAHLNFEWIFHEKPESLAKSINIFKKTIPIAGKDDSLLSKIDSEAQGLIEKLKKMSNDDTCNTLLKFHEETYRFVARSAYMWLTSGELKDSKLKKMQAFFDVVGQISVASNYIPPWMAKIIYGRRIKKLRKSLIADFEPQIQEHRQDTGVADSKLIRICLDSLTPMTNEEIGENLVSFMAAGLDSTYSLLNNCVTNLTIPKNADICEELRQECEECLQNDPKELLGASLLNAFILETARLSPNYVGNFTGAIKTGTVLENYVIENDVHFVGLCAQILMSDESSAYNDPKTFNPKRFMGENPENSSAFGVIKWGGGRHGCPARMFSITNIKLVLARLVLNFDFTNKGNTGQVLSNLGPLTADGERPLLRLRNNNI